MKRIALLAAFALVLALSACGGKSNSTGSTDNNHSFAGTFTDEFGNRFELLDDYRGTIQFDKHTEVDSITWFDGENHDRPYATINYNGDPTYYYLRDGSLYRHQDDMERGRCAIKISYE